MVISPQLMGAELSETPRWDRKGSGCPLRMTVDRSTIDKLGVMGLSGHVSGARAGRHLESDGSVTGSVLRPKTVGMTVRAKSAS
jgi:hypothetical protein